MPLEQGASNAESERKPSAGVIADEIQGRHRRLSRTTDGVKRARECDVVDVVAGSVCERPILSPSGDTPVNKPGISRQARLWAEAQPLGHSRPESLDQRIRFLHERKGDLDRFRALQVKPDGAPATRHDVEFRIDRQADIGRLGAIDAQDVGTHICKQHAAERAGPDAGKLKDAHARERTAHA
jgi:hypothetical protein